MAGTGLDGGTVTAGAWHHVAFTVDASGGKLYVDGVLRASRAWTGASGPPTTTQGVRLGIDGTGTVRLVGLLDEITIWNAALNLSQVQSNLFTTLTGSEANLLAFFRCDEGGGTTVADSAPLDGNNNGGWVGTPAGDCRNIPGVTLVRLDWSGQNLVGCKVELSAGRSRIQRVAPDCTTTYYADLPPEAPRQWTILSQPVGANAQITVTNNGASATLSLPRAGDYTVQLTVCPGDCVVPEPGGASNFPMITSTGAITIRAELELPLRVQERPVLPPSAMVPTPRLDLPDSQRDCMCQGGGGYLNPQWVTVNQWNGANDYQQVEGSVVKCWPSTHDALVNHNLAISLGGWYVIHDIGVTVSPDPRYYHLLSTKPESESNPHLLGCEAQNDTIPERFRPVEGAAFPYGASTSWIAGTSRFTRRFIPSSAGRCIAIGPCAFRTTPRSRLISARTW